MRPFLSIVIPCRDEAASIRRCLESVLASNYPPDRMEILVADGMSTDATRGVLAEIAAEDNRVRVLENPERVTPCGLNLAIREARGEFLARVDAHSVLDADYLGTLVRFLEDHPGAWGAGGRMTTEPEQAGVFSRAIPLVLAHRCGVGNSQFRTGGGPDEAQRADTVFNCCWRANVFARVGLFHPKLTRSQDIEFSRRIRAAGGELWWVPAAHTTYFARVQFLSYLRHNWANGIWAILPALYLGHFPVRLRHLAPLFFFSSLIIAAAIGLVTGLMWLPLLLVISPYASMVSLASLQLAVQHRDPLLLALLPLSFAGLHIAYGAGSAWGALLMTWRRITAHPSRPHSITQETI